MSSLILFFSGCEESLDKQGLKPSLVKQIIKTWKLKARVYHEIRMFGLLTDKTFHMDELTIDYDHTMSPLFVKNIVRIKQGAAKSMGITFLALLRLCCVWQTKFNNIKLNNPHLSEQQCMDVFDTCVQEFISRIDV